MSVTQDTAGAMDLATKALQIKPSSFEAYYARARARRDDRFVDVLTVIVNV